MLHQLILKRATTLVSIVSAVCRDNASLESLQLLLRLTATILVCLHVQVKHW